ncbi:MAG: 4-hydroxy-tetrahydrodipicolinate synthase [Oscillospiraceae bacterium]|nr:4-hydroxy-tetrahydrodipicolinate synthase [Oscillospiraceae bacterium]
MSRHTVFTGCATALITPFKKDFSVNYEAFEKLIDFQLDSGIKAFVVCGTTGEAATLSDEEQSELISCAISRAKPRGAAVIAGAGSNSTSHAIKLSQRAAALGADALLHVTPYYNKTTQRGLTEHFKAIAAAAELPVILYSVPSRTGLSIAPETYLELSRVENIVAAKEASGDFTLISRAMQLCGDNLDFYSGNDDHTVALMSLGAKGLISVLSNVKPAEAQRMCSLALEGDFKGAARLQLEFMPLITALFSEVNPIPVKDACNLLGFEAGPCRLPLSEMNERKRETLEGLLNVG